jgi:hypothetical protein
MRPTHLDDELLSAHLDGEAPEAADHLAACADCRARFDALAAAARLVGTPPVPLHADAVDAAVARAVGGGERANRRPMLAALAAAAVAVLGIVGVGVLDGGGGDDAGVTALADRDESGAGAQAGSEAVTDGGDLGDLTEARAVADAVRAAVEPPAEAAGDSAVMAAPTGGGSSSGATTVARRYAPALRAGSDAKAGAKDPYCEETVAITYAEGLGPLVYRATLRWEGTPAVAVAYTLAKPQGELDHRIYVLAVDDCRLLVAQTV